ncbi:MAG: polysaccharide lyase [Pseudonocardia sp.]|nr:polysaccharide lyase [Pseudonocardia sp.]
MTLSGGTMEWRGDFDTRNTSQWELETARSYSLQVLDGGAGHATAGRFEVRDGDTPVDSGERSEAKAPNWTDVSDGDERWYSFSMMFDKSFPVPADGWCDPMQWHTANADHSAADGSPALNLQCGNNGDDKLYLQVGDRELFPIGILDRGMWHQYMLHVKFSNDPGTAFEEVHRDGQLVLPKISPRSANMTTPKAYLKIGMYRKGTNHGPMVVWHDGMAVYTSPPTMSTATGPAVTSTMQILPAGQPDDVMLTGNVN